MSKCSKFKQLQQDQFQRLLPTFIQIIELTEEEENLYWNIMSAVFEGKPVTVAVSNSNFTDKMNSIATANSTLTNTGINNKVQ